MYFFPEQAIQAGEQVDINQLLLLIQLHDGPYPKSGEFSPMSNPERFTK